MLECLLNSLLLYSVINVSLILVATIACRAEMHKKQLDELYWVNVALFEGWVFMHLIQVQEMG